ncbi:pyridoxal-dependent decarboxylase, exosortase A system-associated [Motiliproteus sediminis]|uniref:pyridoxal-dependent decarboxylase, exosortase A system-associated n=1 Tax=Motiliproteus sediminis TaxID=1468178 RepID=UPI001AEF5647|nr:pyridoxal-dependent decarboxylase, exosortase A system-associated [Motiliproteus sediminis]
MEKTAAIHHSDWHAREQGKLRIGGYSPEQVCAIAGGTPCYVYDRAAISARVEQLRAALPPALELHYAIKANPMAAVVQHLATLVDGLDVASQRELQIALATGVAPGDISFAGPGKSDADITAAVAAGITLMAESLAQVDAAIDAAECLGIAPRIALRVNPAFELKASGMKMTGGAKPFGIDSEQLPQVIDHCRQRGVEPCGLHLFTGSQNLNPEAICEAHSAVTALALELIDAEQLQLQFINIGGGLGIPYFPGEQPLQLAPIGVNLDRLQQQVAARCDASLVLEMGRYLVGEAGLYLCRVREIKQSRGTTYLVVDGGLHQHLANSGNFGQVIRKNYPVELVGGSPQQPTQVTVVGPLCTPLDIVADKVTLPKACVGDLVVVRQSGAYGFTASPRDFLGHPHPCELLL